jgi:hypothetical protein
VYTLGDGQMRLKYAVVRYTKYKNRETCCSEIYERVPLKMMVTDTSSFKKLPELVYYRERSNLTSVYETFPSL